MNNRELAEHIFLAGVKGVLPDKIINDLFSVRRNQLKIGYLSYNLEDIRNIWVIGAGKASAAMAHYLENIIGAWITGGQIITKYGFYCRLKKIRVIEAGHPVPDEKSFEGTREIIKIAETAGEKDLVICLWSGGGSSLLADYPETSSALEIQYFNEMLVRCGADIIEMNTIRKHLSCIKGGQLAKVIWPASFVSIILSDVIGDHTDVIASGPTVPDNSTYSDALKVLEKYQLVNDIPAGLLNYIKEGINGTRSETPKPNDIIFNNSVTILAGNNKTAILTAKIEAEKLGLATFIVTRDLSGDIDKAVSFIIDSISGYRKNCDIKKPVCLLFGGETTVKVTGEGMGGRNQHLALTIAMQLQHIKGVTFLSAGTDGNDGNTDMAGAVVDSETVHDALSMNIDPERFIREFNSYNFFESAGGHVCTGPTMTNVMDIAIALIE